MGLTKKQKEFRKIGASDAPVIMHGVHYDKTVFDLWEEKTGRKEPENLDRILRVQMGNFTEPHNRKWYSFETGNKVKIVKDGIAHPDHPFMTAHLDGITSADGVVGNLQCKHTGAFTKSDPAETYYPQVQHEMATADLPFTHLSVFKGTDQWASYHIDRDDEYIAQLIEREAEFWFHVEMDTPPPGTEPIPSPEVNPEKVVDMTGNNGWAFEAGIWLENKPAKTAFEAAAKELKTMVEEDAAKTIGHGIVATRTKRGVTIKEDAND